METQEYSVILVGIDGSEQALQAFEKAVEVAKRNDAKVVLANVVENRLYTNMGYSMANADLLQSETDRTKELLEEYKQYGIEKDFTNIETIVSFGSPKIIMAKELPKKYNADLIMVGQSGLNAVERVVVGSVSEYIIRNAPCDVLIVRPDESKNEE